MKVVLFRVFTMIFPSICLVFLLCIHSSNSHITDSKPPAGDGPDNKIQDGRLARKDKDFSVIYGYYQSTKSPNNPHLEVKWKGYPKDANYDPPTSFADFKTDETEDTAEKYTDLPTSFEDFMPDDSQKSSRYNFGNSKYQRGMPPSSYADWKFYSPDHEMVPSWDTKTSDMVNMLYTIKHLNPEMFESKQPGFLEKLKSEPLVLVLATTLPLTILLSAVLPSIANILKNGFNSNVPTITTEATGSRPAAAKSDYFHPLDSMLEAARTFNIDNNGKSCFLQKAFCEMTLKADGGRGDMLFQRSFYKLLTLMDDYWLETFGVKELMTALGSGNCERIACPNYSNHQMIN